MIKEQNILKLRSPKRNPNKSSNRHSLFPYYAGYSEEFASDAINLFAKKNALILDPWNGAGTTSLVSSILSIDAIGVDLNPAMVIVAKARIAREGDYRIARKKIVNFIYEFKKIKKIEFDDPLDSWIIKEFSTLIRYMVKRTFGDRKNSQYISVDDVSQRSSSAEAWQCIIMLVLFRVVKFIASDAKSSNPTWIKNFINEDLQNKSVFLPNVIIEEFEKIKSIRNKDIHNKPNAIEKIICGSSEKIAVPDASIDFILTSPPYCTRIDYAVSTILELAVLGLNKNEIDNSLRNKLIGTTSNKGTVVKAELDWGVTCNSFLKFVLEHPSHGSKSYYYKNFCQYFSSIYNSISELRRVLKDDGLICVVLQGSNYKEFKIDLTKIFLEMANKNGLLKHKIFSFSTSQFFIDINSKSNKYRGQLKMSEDVLVLSKAND